MLAIELPHRPGQLLKVAEHLGKHHINIEHSFLTVELPKKKAIVIMETNDPNKAEKILKDAGFNLCKEIVEPPESLATPLATELEMYPRGDKEELIKIMASGESSFFEFKSTMRYDIHTHIVNKELGAEICKSIAAFMNSNGGVVLIGVNADGTVRGLDDDFKTLGKLQNKDGFLLAFSDIITSWDMLEYTPLMDYYFADIDGTEIFVVEVRRSVKREAWLERGEFYIRAASSDRRLNPRQTTMYINERWPRKRHLIR